MTARPGAAGGLVTLGETMVLLSAPGVGRLRHVRTLDVGVGGAETNVAIGVARLGLPAAWIGRVGDDELGELVVAAVRGAGVDVSAVVRDPEVATSLMVKERRTAGVTRVHYYRRHGPGSRLSADDVDPALVAGAGVLHVTGITPALGGGPRAAVARAVALAREAGVPVSLDVNHRSALWAPHDAAAALRPLLAGTDVVFAGEEEAELLGCTGSPEQLARGLVDLGPSTAVLKLGARGAVAVVDGRVLEVPPVEVVAVDAVGAGDAFVAGYLAELLSGAPAEQRLRTAAACGAHAVTVPGDWEGLPTREDVAAVTAEAGTVVR